MGAGLRTATAEAGDDAEVWFIHPYERTLTAWRRRPDGSYDEIVVRDGTVRPVALSGVEIELGMLFL